MALKHEVRRDVAGIRIALERIASALEALVGPVGPMEATAAPAGDVCGECGAFEPDDRIDFGTTNGRPDWQCRRCGWRSFAAVPQGVGG